MISDAFMSFAWTFIVPITVVLVMFLLFYRIQQDKSQGLYTVKADFLGSLLVAMMFTGLAITNWNDHRYDTGHSLWAPLLFLGLLIIISRLRQKSWKNVLYFETFCQPKDEREEAIAAQTARMTFGLSLLVIIIILVAFLIFPNPSKNSIMNLMVAVINLLYSSQQFIAWRLGLK